MSKIVCQSCGQTVDSTAQVCRYCGEPPTAAPETFTRCSNGHIVSDGAQFCPWCGEAIRRNSSPAGAEEAGFESVKTASSRTTVKMDGKNDGRQANGIPPMTDDVRKTMVIPKPGQNRTVIIRPGSPDTAEEAKIVGFLISYSLSPAGAFFPLKEGRQNIGSGQAVRIKIADGKLSEEHAIILYRNGRFIFEDRLSSNGSYINGQEAVGQIELHHGDELLLGSHTYIFVNVPVKQASSSDAP